MTSRIYVGTVVVSAVLAILPFLALWVMHGNYATTPQFMDDSTYYYARMEAVSHGHPFIGNPYLVEHANDDAAAFFGADWFAAFPLLLGIPLLAAVLLNAIVWFTIMYALCIWLYREFGASKRYASFGALLTIIATYWFLQRPVAMEIVHPVFVLFLIAYVRWLKEPKELSRQLLLAAVAALSFYIYTYEWQIVVLVGAFTHVLLIKECRKYHSLWKIDIWLAILAAPMVWYTVHQLHHPLYWETMHRIGLVETHTVGASAIWVIFELALIGASFFLISHRRQVTERRFVYLVTLAIAVAAVSNVISGKDLETGVHVGRFVDLWGVVVSLYGLSLAWPHRKHVSRRILIGVGGSILMTLLIIVPSVRLIRIVNEDALHAEQYAPLFSWLNENTTPGSVVWADNDLSYYVPAETSNYVLFQSDAEVYLVSNKELEERYLVSHLLDTPDLTRIENDYRQYAGVGNAVHAYKVHNRERTICLFLHLNTCGEYVSSSVAYRGVPYFKGLLALQKAIQKDPLRYLQTYSVATIIVPAHTALPKSVATAYALQTSLSGFDIYTAREGN